MRGDSDGSRRAERTARQLSLHSRVASLGIPGEAVTTAFLERRGGSGGTHVSLIQALVSYQNCFEKVAGFQVCIGLKMLCGG
jgi:hypothetical protein